MSLLDREIERAFTFPEDLALARIPDTQGLGGIRSPNRSCEARMNERFEPTRLW